MYECERCGYSTSLKYNLKLHKQRKNPCKDKNRKKSIHACEYCDKSFSLGSNLNRHLKSCKSKLNNINELKLKELFHEEQELLLKRINELEHIVQNSTMMGTINNNCTTNSTNNIDNSINITINNYGHENLDYLTDDFMAKLISRPASAIPNLFKEIHLNDNHPENQNIRITNKKLPHAQVFKHNRWHHVSKKKFLQDELDKNYNRLDDFYQESDIINETHRKRFDSFQENFEGNSKIPEQIKFDIEMDILNYGPN